MKTTMIFIITLSLFTGLYLFSESLWNDNAADLYNRRIFYKAGDSIEIWLDEKSVIDYKSTSKSLKSYSINIQGGEMSGILAFIPKGNIEENKTAADKDQVVIKNILQGRITAVGNGTLTVNATKTVSVNNRQSSFGISGDVSMADIQGNSIVSSKIINPVISITTLIDNSNQVLNAADLQTVVTNPDSTTDRKEETKLSDAKKRELLLNYFNKVLNVIF